MKIISGILSTLQEGYHNLWKAVAGEQTDFQKQKDALSPYISCTDEFRQAASFAATEIIRATMSNMTDSPIAQDYLNVVISNRVQSALGNLEALADLGIAVKFGEGDNLRRADDEIFEAGKTEQANTFAREGLLNSVLMKMDDITENKTFFANLIGPDVKSSLSRSELSELEDHFFSAVANAGDLCERLLDEPRPLPVNANPQFNF
jgi:hypothetical protein